MSTDTMLTPFTLISGSVSSSQNAAGSGNGSSVKWPMSLVGAALQLKVTAAPSTSAATLDVYVQHAVDTIAGSSSTYDDFIHFTQVGGTVSAVGSQLASWLRTTVPSSSLNMHTPATLTLAAGQIRHGPTGDTWRVSYVVTNGGAAASSSAYAFSVVVQPYRS